MEEKKGIGLFTCVTIIVGSMIGSAIFSLSGLTMYQAGPSAILSWILAAVIMLIYGFICTELSTIFPKSGGVYVFPAKAFDNKLLGWVSTWGYINGNIVAVAFAAIYVGTYLGAGFGLGAEWQVPLAVIATLFCIILNCINFEVAGKLNSILVISLLISMAIYVVSCFTSGNWDPQLLTPFMSQGALGKTGFLSAVPTAMLAYGSIVAIAFMVGEVRKPEKTVPKAVVIAMTIVTVIYSLIIIATLGLITAGFLAENAGMRYIPLYAVCFTKLSQISWLAKVVSIAAVLALITTMLIVLALTARALQAASTDGSFFRYFAKNNKHGVPARNVVIIGSLAGFVSCFPGFTEWIVNFGALFGAATICINIISLFKARREGLKSYFKAPGGQILPAVAFVLIAISYIPDLLSGGILLIIYTVVWYLVGIGIFKLCQIESFRKHKK